MLSNTLTGLRVLDFTHVGAGPTCTMLLADMGADVIKVESLAGDLARTLGPPWRNGESAWFMSLNRNKRSIAVDLKHPAATPVLRRLLKTADVVVESYRPGVAARLRFGYEDARKMNPSVVYCSISAYGQTGPWSDRAGVDGILQANTGLMSIIGHDGAEPCKMPIPIVDMSTGYLASNAILASLLKSRRQCESAHLDISMFNCSVMLQQTAFAAWAMSGELPPKSGSAAPYAAPNEAYPTGDGWLMIAAYHDDRWRRLCDSLDLPELYGHPDFADLSLRVKNRKTLREALANRLQSKSAAQWVNLLLADGIMCAEVADYDSASQSAPFMQGRLQETIAHERAGQINMPRFALDPAGGELRYPPPSLGENTRQVLGELGFAGEDIDHLVHERAVAA